MIHFPRAGAPPRPLGCTPDGFTLLEVMVAMAILATAFAAVLRLHADSMDMVIESRVYTRAAELAQMKMTEVEVTGLEKLAMLSGEFQDIAPDYYWVVEVEPAPVAPWKRVSVRVANKNVKGGGVRLVSYILSGELDADTIKKQ